MYIVGGENVISKEVSDKLYKYYGKNVKRIQGQDRYQTSIEVANEIVKKSNGKVDTFVVGGKIGHGRCFIYFILWQVVN